MALTKVRLDVASTSQVHAGKGQSGKGDKRAKPISAHPAFPYVVALWFGALFGLGSLVLPDALFERAITATGIAGFVPAAAPPLGFTARATIALVALVLGASMGLAIARRIVPAAPDQPRRRSFKAEENPRRQPLSAREELGSDSFDSVAGFATARRRALAAEEEERVSDYFHVAPLPGQRHEQGFAFADKAAPFDLAECAEFTEVQEVEPYVPSQVEENVVQQIQVFSPIEVASAAGDPLPFSPPSMARFEDPAEPVAAEASFAEPVAFAGEHEEEVGHDAEFEIAEQPAPFAPAQPAFEAKPAIEATRQEFLAAPAQFDPPVEVAVADSDAQPGLVQLVQKLGATLERHREWNAQRHEQQAETPRFPRAVFSAAFGGEDFGAAERDEAAQAMAAFFSANTAAEPVADVQPGPAESFGEPVSALSPDNSASGKKFQPFAGLGNVDAGEEDEDFDSLAASFTLPHNRNLMPATNVFAQPAAVDVEDETDDAQGDEAYSSLLVMKNPFKDHRPEFVRVEEPEAEINVLQPTVIFPHEEVAAQTRLFDRPANVADISVPDVAADPAAAPARPLPASEESDRILREALMNLQRIGKSA